MADLALIADLVRSGVDAELIGRVANALISSADNLPTSADAATERRRARDRKYQKNRRKSRKTSEANDAETAADASADRLPTKADARCNLSSFLSEPFNGRKEESRPPRKQASKEAGEISPEGTSRRGSRISVDWQPSEADRQFAVDAGMSADAIDALRAEFVDYWISVPGQRGLKLNWSATWRNRVRAVGTRPRVNGHVLPRPGSREDRQEKTYHALQKLRQYAHPQADATGESSGDGEPPAWDVSIAKPS